MFGTFVFYQQLHGKNFNGESRALGLAVNIFGFTGMLTGLAFLVFCFLQFSWWTPIAVFAIGLLAQIPMVLLERVIQPPMLSIAGLVVWPSCAYLMFAYA